MPRSSANGGTTRVCGWTSATLAALTLLALGCGGERTFDAETLVAELDDAGIALELGEELSSDVEDVEVRVVTLAGTGPTGRGAGGFPTEGEAAGAVVILDDVDAARAEFERCESAISFVCYRAANAVLRFSQIGPAEQARISEGMLELESSGG